MRSMLDALTPESGLWFEFILDATFKVILVVGLALIVLLIWKKSFLCDASSPVDTCINQHPDHSTFILHPA